MASRKYTRKPSPEIDERRRFLSSLRRSISFDDADFIGVDGPYFVGVKETPRQIVVRQAIDNWRLWLPALLEAWGTSVAPQLLHGRNRRQRLTSPMVLKAIHARTVRHFGFADPTLRSLHAWVWPPASWLPWDRDSDEFEQLSMLALRYVSSDTLQAEGACFGISERTLQRRLEEIHRRLARDLVSPSKPLFL